MTEHFTWIPFYEELATRLISYEDQQTQLISFLETLRASGLTITMLTDKDAQGARFLLTEIDPFTFFGTFNRGITDAQRAGILQKMKANFHMEASVPSDFFGLPTLNNRRSWFIAYQSERETIDVRRLWSVFKAALDSEPLTSPDFRVAFDEALKVKYTNINLTIGLFWIRPGTFLVSIGGTGHIWALNCPRMASLPGSTSMRSRVLHPLGSRSQTSRSTLGTLGM